MSKKLIAGAAAAAALLLSGGYGAYSGLEGGKSAAPYRDIAGVWTDCNGNTKNVNPNRVRSDAECAALLSGETQQLAEYVYNKVTKPISVKTLASFVSFAYNVGPGAFSRSTLLRKYNAGDYLGACREMFRWTYAGGAYVPGLYNRREIEYALCVEGLQ